MNITQSLHTFHEDGRVRVGLGHFLLAFLQARQHVVRNNDRFEFLLLRAGVFSIEKKIVRARKKKKIK